MQTQIERIRYYKERIRRITWARNEKTEEGKREKKQQGEFEENNLKTEVKE